MTKQITTQSHAIRAAAVHLKRAAEGEIQWCGENAQHADMKARAQERLALAEFLLATCDADPISARSLTLTVA